MKAERTAYAVFFNGIPAFLRITGYLRKTVFALSSCLLVYALQGLYRPLQSSLQYRRTNAAIRDGTFRESITLQESMDVFAVLTFDSGLLAVPVMRDEADNPFYIDHGLHGEEDPAGMPFTFNAPDDPVITVFGHLVYYDDQAAFSPLQVLMDPDVCEANRFVNLVFLDETRRYEIRSVFTVDEEHNTDFPAMPGVPSPEWIDYAQYYRMPGTSPFTAGDRFLVLQTCCRNRKNVHLLIVAAEIE